MGFGTEILFIAALGCLLFGPKRLPGILGGLARVKAQLETAARNVKSQAVAELNSEHGDEKTGSFHEVAGDR